MPSHLSMLPGLRFFTVVISFFLIVDALPLHAAEPNNRMGLSETERSLIGQGGAAHMLLEMGVDGVLKEALADDVEDIRSALRAVRIRYRNLGVIDDCINVTITNPDQVQDALEILKSSAFDVTPQPSNASTFSLCVKDEDKADIVDMAVLASMNKVQQRIGRFLKSANLPAPQRIGNSNRFITQLPAGFDPTEVERTYREGPFLPRLTFHIMDKRQFDGGEIPAETMQLKFRQLSGHPPNEKQTLVYRRVQFSGHDLLTPKLKITSEGEPTLHVKLKGVGVRRFEALEGQTLAMIVDQEIIAILLVQGPFQGQTVVLKGGFSLQSARQLIKDIVNSHLGGNLKVLREWATSPGYNSKLLAGQ